jgi:hypothetical protein
MDGRARPFFFLISASTFFGICSDFDFNTINISKSIFFNQLRFLIEYRWIHYSLTLMYLESSLELSIYFMLKKKSNREMMMICTPTID